jgi:hypothetical protein
VDPPRESHPGEPQDLGDPAGALAFEEEQERGDLEPEPSARRRPGQGEQVGARHFGMAEF